MFDDIIKETNVDEKLVKIEKSVNEISKSFHEMLSYIELPVLTSGRGLSGYCGDWPTEDTIEARYERILKSSYVIKGYMNQITDMYKEKENENVR